MKNRVNWEAKVKVLEKAITSGAIDEITKAKIDCVLEASNLFEVIINYITLERNGFAFDFGSHIIPKGTIWYRIRRYDPNIDYSDKKQWTAPPHKPQNRANREGEKALYLNTMDAMCILETHIQYGEQYVLAKYECVDDIEVGGYITCKDDSWKTRILGIILNALLISPSRNEENKELFKILDKYWWNIMPEDLKNDSLKNEFLLPFKFAVMNQRQELYGITNILCDCIKKRYSMGIKYSSCYCLLEAIDIESNCYNVVLYESGISKVQFVNCEVKQNENIEFAIEKIVSSLLNASKEQKCIMQE